MRPLLALALALVALTPCGVRSQAYPAFFDDFTYARDGTPHDGVDADALLGANRWLVSPSGASTPMRAWTLGGDDDNHRGTPEEYFRGPGHLVLTGEGPERRLVLTIDPGFPEAGVRHPLIATGQVFEPAGTFAARVRFSALEERQRMTAAFWIDSPDELRFCPPDLPACDPRTTPPGMLAYWSEADFEFNNWFYSEPLPSMTVGAGAYRRHGAGPEGSRAGPIDCLLGARRQRQASCRDASGRSSLTDRWLLLVFQLDSSRVVTERGERYGGALSFVMVDDEPGRTDRITGVGRGDVPGLDAGGPAAVWRTNGRGDASTGLDPTPIYPRNPVSIMLSLGYWGRNDGATCPPDASGGSVTCAPLTMDVDWVYHAPTVLSPDGVRREVAAWRGRGAGRVNTLGRLPYPLQPPQRPAGADPAQLALALRGPRATSGPAEWTVGPATPRSIIYGMEVEAVTRCAPTARACRPRTIRPYAPYISLAPAPGETGMTIRAKLQDPWYGYTHVPTPGSAWREWEVRFTR